MGEDLGVGVGKDQREFVGKPLPVMQNPGSVFFFLFPVVRELYRAPVGDVALFSFAKHAIEHSGGAKKSISVSSRKMGSDIASLGGNYAA